jgi:PleD family two-component response regulator
MKNDTYTPTILIVDDEPSNISILNELLQTDYNIIFSKDGPTAIKIATSNTPPDLILLDIVMPNVDGYQVAELLKKNEAARNIPIIFITGKGKEDDEVKGFELGAVDYITKPFKPIIVKARVKSQLELKRHRDFVEWMLRERTKELEQMEKEYLSLFYRKTSR